MYIFPFEDKREKGERKGETEKGKMEVGKKGSKGKWEREKEIKGDLFIFVNCCSHRKLRKTFFVKNIIFSPWARATSNVTFFPFLKLVYYCAH